MSKPYFPPLVTSSTVVRETMIGSPKPCTTELMPFTSHTNHGV